MSSCAAAGLSFTAVAGVRVCTNNHLACFVVLGGDVRRQVKVIAG